MKNKKKTLIIVTIVIAILAIVAVIVMIANKDKVYRIIAVDSMSGTVDLRREDAPVEIFEGMHLKSGDGVKTGKASHVLLLADSDKQILAEANTGFSITATGDEEKGEITIHLDYGATLITIDNKLEDESSFDVETPNATLSVRGTIFKVEYNKDLLCTTVDIREGTVEIKSKIQSVIGNAGETYFVGTEGVIEKVAISHEFDESQVTESEQGEEGNQGAGGNLEIGTDIEPLPGDGSGSYDSIPQAEFESLYLVERIELTPENSHEYFQVIEKDGTYNFVLKPGYTPYQEGIKVVLDDGSEATVSAGGSRYIFYMEGEGNPETWIESWTASGTIIKHNIPNDLWFKAGDKFIIMIKMDNGNVYTIER